MRDQWNPELQARINQMAKELLQIGGDCASPKDLQHYLSELSGLASAIRYSVEHAACGPYWRRVRRSTASPRPARCRSSSVVRRMSTTPARRRSSRPSAT